MKKKELTDEEIVKALEICAKDKGCGKCPYKLKDIDCGIGQRSENDYLKLIQRLQKDYANLKEKYVKVLDLNEKVIAEQKAEIERLTEESNEMFDRHSIENQAASLSIEKRNKENSKLKKQVDKLTKENKRLTEENRVMENNLDFHRNEKFELQKQVDELKEERENMQAEILRFEDMKFTQEHCDLYSENETLKQWLQRLNADLENEKNWGKIQTKQAVKDTAKEIYDYIKSIEEHGLPTSCVGEWVKNRLKERYGVEVE
jgi:chromosome segregation ATPase